ncbi:MAG TPA: hypothetical protein VGS12_13435 [Caulobacteraceae bacterium]|nr:hypothetical protein [Caulobacteraceae bacterium]
MKLDRDALRHAAESAYYVLGHGRRVYCTRQEPSPDWSGLSPDQQAMLRQHATWVVGAYIEFLAERGARARRPSPRSARGATPRPRSHPPLRSGGGGPRRRSRRGGGGDAAPEPELPL